MKGPSRTASTQVLDDLLKGLRLGRLTVLTGAGVSTECGVPDFRSRGSPWLRFPPIGFAAFMSNPAERVEAWRRKFAMDDLYSGARQGRVHRGLAALDSRGLLRAVITQNIDGLHDGAGLAPERLIELHGNGTYAHCLTCRVRYELRDIRPDFEATGLPPTCACGGPIKSATIAFGQPLDADVIRRAAAAATESDLFIVLGSSLLVRPAATLPALAVRSGARLVIINREPTPLDSLASQLIRGDVGDLFAPPTDCTGTTHPRFDDVAATRPPH